MPYREDTKYNGPILLYGKKIAVMDDSRWDFLNRLKIFKDKKVKDLQLELEVSSLYFPDKNSHRSLYLIKQRKPSQKEKERIRVKEGREKANFLYKRAKNRIIGMCKCYDYFEDIIGEKFNLKRIFYFNGVIHLPDKSFYELEDRIDSIAREERKYVIEVIKNLKSSDLSKLEKAILNNKRSFKISIPKNGKPVILRFVL